MEPDIPWPTLGTYAYMLGLTASRVEYTQAKRGRGRGGGGWNKATYTYVGMYILTCPAALLFYYSTIYKVGTSCILPNPRTWNLKQRVDIYYCMCAIDYLNPGIHMHR